MQSSLEKSTPFQPGALEGFTKTVIDAYLVPSILLKRQRTELVTRAYTLLAEGTECIIFSVGEWDYLLHGPGRYIVRGHGATREHFQETDERLRFFLKPGFAPPARLPVPDTDLLCVSETRALERDAAYHYTLASRPTSLVKASREIVELATPLHTVQLKASLFWNFVFATEESQAEISVAHTAGFLGLSVLTLRRRIGEGKLPAVRASSSYPGLLREHIEEYIAYRQIFPQGCISPQQNARYEAWRAAWREQNLSKREPDPDWRSRHLP